MAQSLSAFIPKLEAMARPSFLLGVATKMAAITPTMYQAGFDRKVDPYGNLWEPRKEQVKNRSWRKTGKTLMNRTGYLRASGEISRLSERGFVFRVYAPYGGFHQFGTKHMVARKLIPNAASGLGLWGPKYTRIASAEMRAALK